jgi:cell division protein FtsB
MSMLQEIRKRGVAVSLQVFAACMVVYFGFHAVQGERGFLAYVKLNKELQQAELQSAAVSEQRAALEMKVAGLRPESLDLDLLDERARLLLNYGQPTDGVVRFDGNPRGN